MISSPSSGILRSGSGAHQAAACALPLALHRLAAGSGRRRMALKAAPASASAMPRTRASATSRGVQARVRPPRSRRRPPRRGWKRRGGDADACRGSRPPRRRPRSVRGLLLEQPAHRVYRGGITGCDHAASGAPGARPDLDPDPRTAPHRHQLQDAAERVEIGARVDLLPCACSGDMCGFRSTRQSSPAASVCPVDHRDPESTSVTRSPLRSRRQ